MLPTHLEIHNVPGNVPDWRVETAETNQRGLKLVMYADDVIVYVSPPEASGPANTDS